MPRPEAPHQTSGARPCVTVARPFPQFQRIKDMTQATDFYAQMLDSHRRAAEQRVATRASLLVELRALGISLSRLRIDGV